MTVGIYEPRVKYLVGAVNNLISRVGFPVPTNTGDRLVLGEKRPRIFLKRTVLKDGG